MHSLHFYSRCKGNQKWILFLFMSPEHIWQSNKTMTKWQFKCTNQNINQGTNYTDHQITVLNILVFILMPSMSYPTQFVTQMKALPHIIDSNQRSYLFIFLFTFRRFFALRRILLKSQPWRWKPTFFIRQGQIFSNLLLIYISIEVDFI